MPKTISLPALRSVLAQVVDPSCSSPPLPMDEQLTYTSTAALLLPGGELIAYAAFGRGEGEDPQEARDAANVLAGVVSEAWGREVKERREEIGKGLRSPPGEGGEGAARGEEDTQEEEEDNGFSFESELGKIYVSSLSYEPSTPNGHATSAYSASPSPSATPPPGASTSRSKSSATAPRYLLFGICAPETVPVSLLRAKAAAVKQYLSEAMPDIAPKAAALKVPMVVKQAGRGTRRVVSARGGGGGEVMV